jgi:hypothetical protein
MIEKPWRICGNDTLGLSEVDDRENPWFGTIPVTPMMDTQLDQIFIQGELQHLRTELLRVLNDKIKHYQREDFFDIYLSIFVLLCNCEANTVAQIGFVQRHGSNVSSLRRVQIRIIL